MEARGGPRLNSVVAAKIGRNGAVLQGSEKICRTDTLAVGYGFTPNTELAQLSGCALVYDGDRGGWVVQVDDDLETCVPGVFAAGEVVPGLPAR